MQPETGLAPLAILGPRLARPGIQCIADLNVSAAALVLPTLERPLDPTTRGARLLAEPAVRTLGKLAVEVSSEGWRFLDPPAPVAQGPTTATPAPTRRDRPATRIFAALPSPADDRVDLKDRLLYLLQPPLEDVLLGKQACLPFEPYSYQLQGIAFLVSRAAALLADEMGLGKTMQAILALRVLFQAGLVRRALVVCPKPLVHNWTRELGSWAPDLPFEVIRGQRQDRRCGWLVSNSSVKLVNYELLTRDADLAAHKDVRFDIVVLDEAQRIKNRDAKIARVVQSIARKRSWALTGTPVENRSDDLVGLFAFVDPDTVPADAPPALLSRLTASSILRRSKDEVLEDLPAKTVRDSYLELTDAQRNSYTLAETEGVIRLNALGDTITVQHVFELVMRLKQICNFDPATGESAKLEQLSADLEEVAASGRKAIVFSQWVHPLQILAKALASLGPLQFHGRIPSSQRHAVLEQFRNDPSRHVLLMSYGTGSVGLNLQFASYVFLFDRWWNPAVEDQAINRAHRIGQRQPVFVTRFIAQQTIEERIAQVLEKKRELFAELIGASTAPPNLGLTQDEIFDLFDLRARPRQRPARPGA